MSTVASTSTAAYEFIEEQEDDDLAGDTVPVSDDSQDVVLVGSFEAGKRMARQAAARKWTEKKRGHSKENMQQQAQQDGWTKVTKRATPARRPIPWATATPSTSSSSNGRSAPSRSHSIRRGKSKRDTE